MITSHLPHIFQNPDVERLPTKEQKKLSIFWYPSAGYDYRPLTFCHPIWQQKENIQTPHIDLFVYTCIPYNHSYVHFIKSHFDNPQELTSFHRN